MICQPLFEKLTSYPRVKSNMNQQLFLEITSFFNDLPRQGVGSTNSFLKAFSLLPEFKTGTQFIDIGCGTGGQTLDLLTHSSGFVTAVDSSQTSLDLLTKSAHERGFADRLDVLCEDITELEMFEQSFDVIWSEGAIYNVGLEDGLKSWRYLLKNDGYIVVNDCCWLTQSPSRETTTYWEESYPGMTNLLDTADCVIRAGYQLLESFVQPENDWWDNFYTPMEKKIALQRSYPIENFPEGYADFLAGMEAEIDLRRNYGEEYGYVFFILKKV
ncbi:MAG: SAM-dependent methyltransferase [Gammaproteobacteria bacterium]